jgi:nitrate/nitrite transporter NarK
MLLMARLSDKSGERRLVVAVAASASAIGFALSAWFKNPCLAMAALTFAFAGQKSTIAPFWAMATAHLSGAGAAAGIAFINSVGNLGGYVGPHLVGKLKGWTDGSNVAALLFLSAALLGMALFTFCLPKTTRPR